MKKFQWLLSVLLFGSVLIVLGVSQYNIFNRRITYSSEDRIFLLPRKEILQRASLGHEMTVADLLWIRGVQFFGGNFTTLTKEGQEYKGEGIRNLFYTLQYLDPHFYQVYEFGSFVFNEGLHDPQEAIQLLVQGSEVFEDDWKLLFSAAFIAFFHLKDNETALDLADQASERPGAPEHVQRFKGQILTQLGSYDAAIEQFSRLIDQSQSDVQRQVAEKNLNRVLRERAIYQLNRAIEIYRERNGHDIQELEDLVREGIIQELHPDPEDGGAYLYVPSTGQVVSENQALDQRQLQLNELQKIFDELSTQEDATPERMEETFKTIIEERELKDPLGGRLMYDVKANQVYVIPAGFFEE